MLCLPPFNKKVLVVDFDPNQQDLTNILKIDPAKIKLFEYLADPKNKDISETISSYKLQNKQGIVFGFDVIPADDNSIKDFSITQKIATGNLREVLSNLQNNYDYILIDSSPNWGLFSQESIRAADVILMPTKHNNLASLENAAIALAPASQIAITKFFPEIGEALNSFGSNLANPNALPIFKNF